MGSALRNVACGHSDCWVPQAALIAGGIGSLSSVTEEPFFLRCLEETQPQWSCQPTPL